MAYPAPDHYPSLDPHACQLCARCEVARACRRMAVIRFDRDEPPVIDVARCTLCFACAGCCAFDALHMP
jgi:MinD superfamily P-loop ATPase